MCAALIVAFIVDMVYSKKNPNTGKGISTFNDRIYAGRNVSGGRGQV